MVKNFILQGSNDDTIWYDIKSFTGQTEWNTDARMFPLDNDVCYRYYRLYITDNNGHQSTQINEFTLLSRNCMSIIKYENTHYAVNQYGGFCSEVLFDGNANSCSVDYKLIDNVKNYDSLFVVVAFSSNNDINVCQKCVPIITANITPVTKFDISILCISYANTRSDIRQIQFPTTDTFRLSDEGGLVAVYKIIGVKGSIPTLLEGGTL